MNKTLTIAGMALLATLALSGCEKKGPAERAGEKLDHAVDAMKNGGKETPSDKLEDAGNNVRDAASDAKDAVTGK